MTLSASITIHKFVLFLQFLFGDHGDRYHGDDANHPGSYMEILLPFLAIILPKHVINSNPEWERNLLINSQRYVVSLK